MKWFGFKTLEIWLKKKKIGHFVMHKSFMKHILNLSLQIS